MWKLCILNKGVEFIFNVGFLTLNGNKSSATVPLCYRATPIEFPTPIEYPAIRYRILWFDDTQDTKVVE